MQAIPVTFVLPLCCGDNLKLANMKTLDFVAMENIQGGNCCNPCNPCGSSISVGIGVAVGVVLGCLGIGIGAVVGVKI